MLFSSYNALCYVKRKFVFLEDVRLIITDNNNHNDNIIVSSSMIYMYVNGFEFTSHPHMVC